MQILKTFIDSSGHRHKVGEPVPTGWDKTTLDHYKHHGMIGAPADAKPQRRAPGPGIKKPAAPSENKPADPVDSQLRGNDESPASLAKDGDRPGHVDQTPTTPTTSAE